MTESVGVLLAGGLARRMGGGDKCLRPLAGETLLARVIARAAPQVGPLILNANGDPARFASYGLPVVADVVEGHAGPLAGILTALDWAAEHAPHCPLVASFATDAPFLPRDLVETMPATLPAPILPAPLRAAGRIRCSVSGRWRSAPTCARPWSSRAEDRPLDRKPQAGGGGLPLRSRGPFFNANRAGPGRGRAPDRGARPRTLILGRTGSL